MKLTPTREEFAKLAQSANLVAVSTDIDTDLDTPVSMYYKLVGEKKDFCWNPWMHTKNLDVFPLLAASPLSICRFTKIG